MFTQTVTSPLIYLIIVYLNFKCTFCETMKCTFLMLNYTETSLPTNVNLLFSLMLADNWAQCWVMIECLMIIKWLFYFFVCFSFVLFRAACIARSCVRCWEGRVRHSSSSQGNEYWIETISAAPSAAQRGRGLTPWYMLTGLHSKGPVCPAEN